MVNLRRLWRRGGVPAAAQVMPEYETDEFKDIVRDNAYILKQNVHKNGYMEAILVSQFAQQENLNGFDSDTIGDLGPTPEFVDYGLIGAETGNGISNANFYYNSIGTADIDNNIIEHPEVLKKIWETRNDYMKSFEERNPNMPDTEKNNLKNHIVKQILVETYYKDKNALMGEKQRSVIINQSLITDVANNATTPALEKFKPDVLKDLFPEGMMPNTAKRTIELRNLDKSPEEIKKQLQAEELFYNMRGIETDDSNLSHFNDVIMASFVQAMADEKDYNTDIDTLLALDATYALDDSDKPTKKRAAQIMRRIKDPKTTYMWLMMEDMEREAKANWWKRFL